MLVEKELIEKAKEKLGDENAFIMAELLELESFDEKNLRACCPYHNEDTPSFIYNKKNKTWHCFGCDKTVDIIDILMENGETFLGAVKYLFEKADIPADLTTPSSKRNICFIKNIYLFENLC